LKKPDDGNGLKPQIEKIRTYLDYVDDSLHKSEFLDFVEMHKDGPHYCHKGVLSPHAG